ncbi:MAG TPA: ABC transporter permease [Gemmataceae bacterium]|nr:ABC transporter permease [Gemmataceae bacterium]
MFAALVLERDFPRYGDMPGDFNAWLQVVGGFAAAALGVCLLACLIRRLALPGEKGQAGPWWDPFSRLLIAGFGLAGTRGVDGFLERLAPLLRRLFALGVLATALIYGALGVIKAPEGFARLSAYFGGDFSPPARPSEFMQHVIAWLLTAGGACALATALLPLLADVLRLRWRRVWALASLTIKEVTRRRVLWVFVLLGIVFLFGTWFIDTKPETQVHAYVSVLYLVIAVLLVLTGSLLASFGIPTDVRQQTIHTVVTKPVERYEIVLGRFLGLTVVLTLVLMVMTGVSLLLFRHVDEEARAESMKARVPYTGVLHYENTPDPEKGENVGEEWEYRGYISGPYPGQPPQYAVWSFPDLPSSLAAHGSAPVPCEFTFAIYRTTTGEINKGVFCTFEVETWRYQPGKKDEYLKKRKLDNPELDDKLAEEYGYYQLPSKEITNYHTQSIQLPAGLFRNQFAPASALRPRLEELRKKRDQGGLTTTEEQELILLEKDARGDARPSLKVRVRCISRTQFLGMAKYDLYLMDQQLPQRANEVRFYVNFFKGTVGIWFWMCLVTGVAVACSTYLSGVIAWLCVGVLFLLGMIREFVEKVAQGLNDGGGPAEALLRLFERKVVAAQLEKTDLTQVATGSDELYRWVMRWFLNAVPDVTLFDFGNLVGSGFDVSLWHLAFTVLYLGAYLLPWAVLAYYLIKSREIATW